MSYQKEREEFIVQFVRLFPKARHSDAEYLLRQASAEQRWNEIDCSIDVGEREHDRMEKASERRIERTRKFCSSIGARLITQGDPRGYPLQIKTANDPSDDEQTRGLGIPGRGLPARCFR